MLTVMNKKGGGTYQRIVRATELMDDYGVDYNILTVSKSAHNRNINTIYKEYKKRGGEISTVYCMLDPLGDEHGKTEYGISSKTIWEF